MYICTPIHFLNISILNDSRLKNLKNPTDKAENLSDQSFVMLQNSDKGSEIIDGAVLRGPESCSDEELKKCADNAEPLYKDTALVVPDNPKAVSKVCRYEMKLAEDSDDPTNVSLKVIMIMPCLLID